MPVGDPRQRADVLVNHQDRLPGLFQTRQTLPDFFADERRKTLGRLIENEQSGIGHQRAADGEHLLLAARELVAAIAYPLAEARKDAEDAFKRPFAPPVDPGPRSAAHTVSRWSRTRPLCAFPKVAKYKGSGSTDDAASFTCALP